jgi:hypothetical protein
MVVATVIIMIVIMMHVTVMVPMSRTGRVRLPFGVGATLRIERGLDLDHARAEAAHHGFDDMVAPDAKALAGDLGRQVPIAEVPGHAHQVMRVLAANFGQRLGGRDDFDEAAIFQNEGIATPQRHGGLKVEQEFQSARAGHDQPPPMPVVKIEDDGIGGLL